MYRPKPVKAYTLNQIPLLLIPLSQLQLKYNIVMYVWWDIYLINLVKLLQVGI